MEEKTLYKSKSKQNIINGKNKISLLKYSNLTVFEKREKELQNKQSKKIFTIKTFLNKNKKNKQYLYQNNFLSTGLEKTDSFPFLLKNISTTQTTYNKTNNKSLQKSLSLNFTPRNRNPSLYLTETELFNNNILIDSTNKNLYSNSRMSDTFSTDFFPKTPNYKDRREEDRDGILLLLKIQKEINKYKYKNNSINLDLKIKELKLKEHGPKTMIKKIKSYKFLQYLSSFRKERKDLFNEEYQTKIDYFKEKINSLQQSLKLFNIKFINKMANYVKYLDNVSNLEKNKNILLIKEIMDHKNDIEKINSEIQKTTIKKNQIMKWIFLQIKVKEKLLALPNYYKKIIAYNKSQIILLHRKFYENNYYKRESKRKTNKSDSSKKKKNILKKSIPMTTSDKNYYHVLRKATNETLTTLRISGGGFKSKKEDVFHEKININLNSNVKEYIPKEEFDKIIIWKFTPIFKTSDEFMDTLRELDNQNLILLKYYNQIQSKIYDYLNELRKMIISKDQSVIFESQINEKLKELEKVQTKNQSLNKTLMKIKEEKNVKIKNSSPSPITYVDIFSDKIYTKIIILLNNCNILNVLLII